MVVKIDQREVKTAIRDFSSGGEHEALDHFSSAINGSGFRSSLNLAAEGVGAIANRICAPEIPGRLWLLDYDGTLTPIVSRPEDAQITPHNARLLKQLADSEHEHVAIVSGRSVEQLRHFLGEIPDAKIVLVGLHGGEIFDMRNNKWMKQPDPRYRTVVQNLKADWQRILDEDSKLERPLLKGVTLEDKTFTLAIHHRNVIHPDYAKLSGSLTSEEIASMAQAQAGLIIGGHLEAQYRNQLITDDFMTKEGKCVHEVAPRSFRKDEAVGSVKVIFNGALESGVHPVSAGDDITDVDAFNAVGDSGTTIFVGNEDMRPVSAAYRVDAPDEVYDLINRVLSAGLSNASS